MELIRTNKTVPGRPAANLIRVSKAENDPRISNTRACADEEGSDSQQKRKYASPAEGPTSPQLRKHTRVEESAAPSQPKTSGHNKGLKYKKTSCHRCKTKFD
eukprot:240369_1